MRTALNRGRTYDCGRVPPLPKQKEKQQPFTLLSFLRDSHTNRRKQAFSESGWHRRIVRGQITIDGFTVRDPTHILSKAKQRIAYHRFPWKEPILHVAMATDQDEARCEEGSEIHNHDFEASIKILYVDEHLLVIHKPSGLPTMPSQTFYEYTVLNSLRSLYNIKAGSTPTNVVATARARQLLQLHCSAEPQPVHRLGVGTSGVLVLASSLLGRQRLTDAIRFKSNNMSSTNLRKVYRALVHARRCDDRPGIGIANLDSNENGLPCNRKGPVIPELFTINCPIGLVPFPISGDSIHAACPQLSDSLYDHVHARHPSLEDTTSETRDNFSLRPANSKKRSTTKPALSHVRVLCQTKDTALIEVEIPTGRPHQIRIHMAYAGYCLVGDPLYLPGGIPNTKEREFECLEKEVEDMDTDDENGNDEDSVNETTAEAIRTTKKCFKRVTKRVTLPRDCGYYLHADTITLEHPCRDQSCTRNDGNTSATSDSCVFHQSNAMTFAAPPPPMLKEERVMQHMIP